tara:strand:+ start:534 stop:698 length:165 start_codon:yes stop_codon:yes gene_type:complete
MMATIGEMFARLAIETKKMKDRIEKEPLNIQDYINSDEFINTSRIIDDAEKRTA